MTRQFREEVCAVFGTFELEHNKGEHNGLYEFRSQIFFIIGFSRLLLPYFCTISVGNIKQG